MRTRFLSVILAACILLTLAFTVGADSKASADWSYIVPFGRYNYCEVLSENLILVGKKADMLGIDMLYGLLDGEGKPLTDIEYFRMGYPSARANADGWISGAKLTDGKIKEVLFNEKGKIVPTPENGKITLFDRSYAVEIPGGYILGVNNKTYRVYKSDIRKAGANEKYPDGYAVDRIEGVYGKCFVVHCGYVYQGFFSDTVVCNLDGTPRYKTEGILYSNPAGLIEGLVLFDNRSSGKVNLTDFDGNVIIPEAYARTGLNPLIDRVTKEPVPGVYIYVYGGYDTGLPYHQGVWDVKRNGEFEAFRWTLYDQVVDCDIKNKLLYLKKDGKMGLYTFSGKQILPFEYTEIYRESGGLIRYYQFEILDENDSQNNYHAQGFVNLKGEIVFEANDLVLYDFSDGLCKFKRLNDSNYICGFMNDKFEVVFEKDQNREWFIEDTFKDGVTIIGSSEYFDGFGGFSFINTKGETVIAPEDLVLPSPAKAAKDGQVWFEAQRGENGLIVLKRYYYFQTGKTSYEDRYITYGIIKYSGD